MLQNASMMINKTPRLGLERGPDTGSTHLLWGALDIDLIQRLSVAHAALLRQVVDHVQKFRNCDKNLHSGMEVSPGLQDYIAQLVAVCDFAGLDTLDSRTVEKQLSYQQHAWEKYRLFPIVFVIERHMTDACAICISKLATSAQLSRLQAKLPLQTDQSSKCAP